MVEYNHHTTLASHLQNGRSIQMPRDGATHVFTDITIVLKAEADGMTLKFLQDTVAYDIEVYKSTIGHLLMEKAPFDETRELHVLERTSDRQHSNKHMIFISFGGMYRSRLQVKHP